MVLFCQMGSIWPELTSSIWENGCIWVKWLYLNKVGCIWPNGFYLVKMGCIWPNGFYLAKWVLFGQNWCYVGKMALFGQSWFTLGARGPHAPHPDGRPKAGKTSGQHEANEVSEVLVASDLWF